MLYRKTLNYSKRAYFAIEHYGVLPAFKIATKKILNKFSAIAHERSSQKLFHKLSQRDNSHIIIYPPYHDFNLPLYQRPQHLAHFLSKKYRYLFHSNNTQDALKKIKKVNKNLFILPLQFYERSLNLTPEQKKILFTYSHPARFLDKQIIEQYLNQGHLVIYDYLDDLNDEIFGHVGQDALERHYYALREKRVILLVTASKLMEQVKQHKPCLTNTYEVPNAVDVVHFQKEKKTIPALEHLKGKTVIGYFGALASWVDYELIKRITEHHANYHVLLLGYVYDEAFQKSNLSACDNLTVLGPIPYEELPDYANYFDISIIPFMVNETTLATSPIKLFEYMALGKPIISTNLPECRKYQSALIAKDHDEFLELIDKALVLSKDNPYFTVMQQESEQNTWDARAKEIFKAIDDNLINKAAKAR